MSLQLVIKQFSKTGILTFIGLFSPVFSQTDYTIHLLDPWQSKAESKMIMIRGGGSPGYYPGAALIPEGNDWYSIELSFNPLFHFGFWFVSYNTNVDHEFLYPDGLGSQQLLEIDGWNYQTDVEACAGNEVWITPNGTNPPELSCIAPDFQPPAISIQPVSTTVIEGDSAVFTVLATGTSLSYQWQKDSEDIPGATGASYKIPATSYYDNNSRFSVTLSNSAGSITSSIATLTVTFSPPEFLTQPSSITVKEGSSAVFSVSSTGSSYKRQWQRNGIDIPGGTGPSYTIPRTVMADNGDEFRVVLSNSGGQVTSNSAVLTVTQSDIAPRITGQPANVTVAEGSSAIFTVIATGTDLKYRWRKDGVLIPGAVASSFTLTQATLSDNGSLFTCLVENIAGSVTSSGAQLLVTPVVSTVSSPASPKVIFKIISRPEGSHALKLSTRQRGWVTVDLINPATGRSRTLVNRLMNQGEHFIEQNWIGAGIHAYRIRTGKTTNTGLLQILR